MQDQGRFCSSLVLENILCSIDTLVEMDWNDDKLVSNKLMTDEFGQLQKYDKTVNIHWGMGMTFIALLRYSTKLYSSTINIFV